MQSLDTLSALKKVSGSSYDDVRTYLSVLGITEAATVRGSRDKPHTFEMWVPDNAEREDKSWRDEYDSWHTDHEITVPGEYVRGTDLRLEDFLEELGRAGGEVKNLQRPSIVDGIRLLNRAGAVFTASYEILTPGDLTLEGDVQLQNGRIIETTRVHLVSGYEYDQKMRWSEIMSGYRKNRQKEAERPQQLQLL